MTTVLFDCRGIKLGETVIFLENGKREVIASIKKPRETSQDNVQPIEKPLGDSLDNPKQLSVTQCLICGLPVPGKRFDRKYCSPKCRKRASRIC